MAPASKSKHAFRTPPRDPGQAEATERPQTLYVPLRFLNSDFPAQSGESAPFRARRAKDGVLHALSVRGCEVARRQAIPAQLAQPNRILTYRSRSPAAIRRESAGTARTTGAQVGVKPTTRGARLLRFPRGDLWCWSGSRWVWCFDCPRLSHRRREVDVILAGSLTRHGRMLNSFFSLLASDLPTQPLLLSACKVRAASLLGTASDLRILLLSRLKLLQAPMPVLRGCYAGATRVLRGCYASAMRCYELLRECYKLLQLSTSSYELLHIATNSYASPTSCYELLRHSYAALPAATPLYDFYAAPTSHYPISPRFYWVLWQLYEFLRAPTSFYAVTLTLLPDSTRCYAAATRVQPRAMRLLRGCYAAALECSRDRDLRYDATSATGSY
ncbi:hypothetical protein B0H17DRAFT_1127843 [Mycena rosella]|uniref:Uncharacterized protein n=1 Tax=Mycena rosella TaxID=1033263 RepID=A0AAD7DZ67_MYCRO|nr:hypothetical protein B0H17DRAFT_1127843 [Mycena rosella]